MTVYSAPKPTPRDKKAPKGLKPRNDKRADAQFEKAFLSEEYVEFVHSLGCCVPGCRKVDIECAHVGSTRKNGGRWFEIAPLCAAHHRTQEGRTNAFNEKFGIDLLSIAAATAQRWLALIKEA